MESKGYKIKVIGHTKVETHTEYIISIEKNEVNFTFSERYKILKLLNDLMKKSTKNNAFPKFSLNNIWVGSYLRTFVSASLNTLCIT